MHYNPLMFTIVVCTQPGDWIILQIKEGRHQLEGHGHRNIKLGKKFSRLGQVLQVSLRPSLPCRSRERKVADIQGSCIPGTRTPSLYRFLSLRVAQDLQSFWIPRKSAGLENMLTGCPVHFDIYETLSHLFGPKGMGGIGKSGMSRCEVN